MKIDTKVRILKIFMFIFNLFCVIVSIYSITAGAHSKRLFVEFDAYAGVLKILGGVAIFLSSFLGCYAILSKSTLFLWIFAFLASVLFTIQLSLVLETDVDEDWQVLLESMENVYENDTLTFNRTQEKVPSTQTHQCCGFYTSYEYEPDSIPLSCFESQEKYNKGYPYEIGCLFQLEFGFESLSTWSFFAAILLIVSEGILAVVSILLGYYFYREDVMEADEALY